MLIRSYIRIQATLLRIAAPANFPTSPSALYRVFDTFPTLFLESGPHLQPHHNGGAAPNVLTLIYLIHLLLSSLCSQSATCSFLFRVILLLWYDVVYGIGKHWSEPNIPVPQQPWPQAQQQPAQQRVVFCYYPSICELRSFSCPDNCITLCKTRMIVSVAW